MHLLLSYMVQQQKQGIFNVKYFWNSRVKGKRQLPLIEPKLNITKSCRNDKSALCIYCIYFNQLIHN